MLCKADNVAAKRQSAEFSSANETPRLRKTAMRMRHKTSLIFNAVCSLSSCICTPEGKKAEEGARKRGLTLHAWLVMPMLAATTKFAVRVCIVGAGTESAGEGSFEEEILTSRP